MNKNTCVVDLKPNRLLLDPSFGGYKLSLDAIPKYHRPLESGVDVVQPSDDQYSFCHIKIFSLHNHLHVSPFKDNSVYYVDKIWDIYKVFLSPLNQLKSLVKVFHIPIVRSREKGHYNVSIKFPSRDVAVVSDGTGTVHIVKTNGDDETETWEVIHSEDFADGKAGHVLSDARFQGTETGEYLHLAAVHVEEKDIKQTEDKESGLFHTKVEWLTLSRGEDSVWRKRSRRTVVVDGSVDYVALEPGCGSVYVVSDKMPKWSYDSENPVTEEVHEEVSPPPKVYTWTQTQEEITIWIPVPEGTNKSDVKISVKDTEVEVKVKDANTVGGTFYHRADKDLTSWVFEKDRVEIHITKQEAGLMWKTLLQGDDTGEEIVDPEVVKSIHEKLAHLCSEREESGVQPSFNSQQLEDCDAASRDMTLVRMDATSHSITHEVNLSSCQWLFKVHIRPEETPAVCCRHDVDACVWQFSRPNDGGTWTHEHVGTFSAFGYVLASKTQKKFTASPPDLSYVAVCETSHRIYVYRQPNPLTTEMKNRRTGQKVNAISRQQLINLEINEPILGVHATNTVLYVLLEKTVCVLVLNA